MLARQLICKFGRRVDALKLFKSLNCGASQVKSASQNECLPSRKMNICQLLKLANGTAAWIALGKASSKLV